MRFNSLSAYAAVLALAACQDIPTDPAALPAPHSGTRATVPSEQVHLSPLEMQFAEIEQSAPGFAGWYFDREGNAVVRTKNPQHQAAALERVGRILDVRGRAGRGRENAARGRSAITGKPAQFSFSELAEVRESVRRNLTEGVYSIDVDEVNNVVSVGVRDETAGQRFRGVVARLGLPAAAVHVYTAPEPQLRDNLSSAQRPIRGGIKHTWTSGTYCSVGINAAYLHSTDYAGYITASHCSHAYMGIDNSTTYYHQPTTGGFNLFRVGYEFDDPVSYTGGSCPAGAGCRRSDAMFVRYLTDRSASANGFNTIFKTQSWGYGARGSTEIDGYLTITGDFVSSPVGEMLDKVGATSGWTYGFVTATCVDKATGMYDKLGRPAWVLCNEISNIWSEGGDSGSPIFKYYGNTVMWAGILWGGPGNNYNETWHSNSYNVAWEMYSYGFYF